MDIFDLERKFPGLAKIKFNGIPGWPLLRIILGYELAKKEFKSGSSIQKGKSSTLLNFIKSIYGWSLWLIHKKKYRYIIFTNNLEKRVYNQRYYDRLFHSTLNLLEQQNVLIINYCEGDIHPLKNSYYKNIANGDILNYMSIIFSRFVKLNISREDKTLINDVLREADIEFDYVDYFKRFIASVKIYRKLFDITKPELVLNGCYTYFPQVHAAKLNGISTIEYQHGMINDQHRGYRTLLNYEGNFTADRLFAFGTKSIFNLDESIYKKEQIRLVGYSYFELLNNGFCDPVNILRPGYDLIICVPVDQVVEKETLALVVKVAPLLKNVLFLINPRISLSNESLDKIKEITNIECITGAFQVIIQQCDYNLTIFSTCAFESVFFGIPNLLYNYQGYARRVFKDILDESSSFYFDTDEELIEFLHHPISFNLTTVKKEGSNFYLDNHSCRIKKELYLGQN